ncbi:hypothetical protein GCM10010272_16750 [Streptomyces lateritius]|nr:hypothetical protein GCM10010272_16750 [Streptomyces lateritius]
MHGRLTVLGRWPTAGTTVAAPGGIAAVDRAGADPPPRDHRGRHGRSAVSRAGERCVVHYLAGRALRSGRREGQRAYEFGGGGRKRLRAEVGLEAAVLAAPLPVTSARWAAGG